MVSLMLSSDGYVARLPGLGQGGQEHAKQSCWLYTRMKILGVKRWWHLWQGMLKKSGHFLTLYFAPTGNWEEKNCLQE